MRRTPLPAAEHCISGGPGAGYPPSGPRRASGPPARLRRRDPSMYGPGNPYQALTRDNTAVLLFDHQIGLVSGVTDFDPLMLTHNVVGLAKAAMVLGLPIVAASTARDTRDPDDVPGLPRPASRPGSSSARATPHLTSGRNPHELILGPAAHPARPRLGLRGAEPPGWVHRHVHQPVCRHRGAAPARGHRRPGAAAAAGRRAEP